MECKKLFIGNSSSKFKFIYRDHVVLCSYDAPWPKIRLGGHPPSRVFGHPPSQLFGHGEAASRNRHLSFAQGL